MLGWARNWNQAVVLFLDLDIRDVEVFIFREVIVIYATFVYMLHFNKRLKTKQNKKNNVPKYRSSTVCLKALEKEQLLVGKHFSIPNAASTGHQTF